LAFGGMRPSKPKAYIPDVPKEYDLDYLVFQLTEGDITKDAIVWDTVTFEDCMRYVCFKQYEAHVNERIMKANG
jgi:hypothetical protein